MSTSPEPRPAPPYGQEAAYAAHPPTDRPTVPPPSAAPGGGPSPYGTPDPATSAPYGSAAGSYAGATYPGTPYRAPMPRNDLAVWSLVLGLLGVLGCVFFTGVPAIVLGGNARKAVAAGEADNEGMATAGIVLGWVATALGVLGLVAAMLLVLPLLFLGFAVPFMATAP